MKQVLSGTGKFHFGDLEFGMATAAFLPNVCLLWIFSGSFIAYFAASCSIRLQITTCSGSFMATAPLSAETVTTFHLLDDFTDTALLCIKRETDLQKERKRDKMR